MTAAANPVDDRCVTLAPSRALGLAIGAVHAATLVPLWAGIDDPGLASALSAAVLLAAVRAINRLARLRSPRSIVGICLGRDCAILKRRDGTIVAGTVSPSSMVTGALAIVVVDVASSLPPPSQAALTSSRAGRRGGKARAVIVTGMLGEDDFRRLRTDLRWGPAADRDAIAVQADEAELPRSPAAAVPRSTDSASTMVPGDGARPDSRAT